ncbi:alpha/beta hydrolase fold domain-containing protein [Streptomyces sp. NPDC001205]
MEQGRGAPRALLVTGEAGSGKTSLLEVAAEHARVTGTHVLRVQGFDGESEQSFAALHQLLLPLIPGAADLPGHLREVLETVFGLAPITRPAEPMRLRVAVLTLLVEASRRRPVVLLGDDVQLFDRDSLDVLGFVLRRLAAGPVTVLLAARGLTPPDPAVAHLPVLSLGPLTLQAAARLLDAQPDSPTGRARSEVLEQADGNPLAIIELCRSVRSGSPLGQAEGALPQTQRIQEMFAAQLRALPAITQRVVLYAAASSDQEDLQTIMSAAGVDADLSVWAPAEDAGLITIAGRQVGFRHPLVRAGAYQGAPAHLRQRAHVDLAAVHQDDPARQAWHLAAACIGQDESVAATLEDTAERVEQRGGFYAAARALERSAACSPALEDRARRYAKALRAANNAGDTFWVRELHAKVTTLTEDRDLLGVAANGAGLALSMAGHQREAFQLLMGALEPDLPQDARTTLAVTAVIGAVAFQSGLSEGRRPLVPLLDAIETSAVSTPYSELVADEAVNALRAVILCEADPVRNAPALLSRTRRPSLLEPLTGIAEMIRLQTLGAVAWRADESELCVDTFRRAFAMLRSYGAIGTGAIALSAMCSALIDVGRWAEADELLDEAATLAAVQKMKHIEVDIEALRVTLQALRGGDAQTHTRMICELVTASDAVFVVPEYTRTPEARYPVALEELYAVLTWLTGNAPDLALDGRRLAVAGDCAGATMATALTLMAKQRGGPRLRAQLLYYATTAPHCDTASRKHFGSGYLLTTEALDWYWQQYTDDDRELAEATASPLRATTAELAGLPPALVITAEADVVRDEAEQYARRLQQAGAAVTAVRYLGTVHDFVSLNALRDSPPTKAAVRQGGAFLKAALTAGR